MTKKMQDVWSCLSEVNANEYKEKRGSFDYLSWSDAWCLLMEHYPDATYEFKSWEYENKNGLRHWRDICLYPDMTASVECSITIEGTTRSMWLPIMDYRNQPIVKPSSTDINKSKMRCLVKCIAMFGLGIYIFAGEDLPSSKDDDAGEVKTTVTKKNTKPVSDKEMRNKVIKSLSAASQLAKLDNVIKHPDVSKWMLSLKDRDIVMYGEVYDQYQLHKKQLERGRSTNAS